MSEYRGWTQEEWEFILWIIQSIKYRDIERFSLDAGLDPENLWLYLNTIHWCVSWSPDGEMIKV